MSVNIGYRFISASVGDRLSSDTVIMPLFFCLMQHHAMQHRKKGKIRCPVHIYASLELLVYIG